MKGPQGCRKIASLDPEIHLLPWSVKLRKDISRTNVRIPVDSVRVTGGKAQGRSENGEPQSFSFQPHNPTLDRSSSPGGKTGGTRVAPEDEEEPEGPFPPRPDLLRLRDENVKGQ